MKRVATAALAALITGLCCWYVLTPAVLSALARLGSEAKWPPLLAAFALVALVQWLRAWRFAVMTTGRLTPPDAAMLGIALKLNFLNFVLPFRLGEFGYPALMRRHYGHSLLRSAGILLLARGLDLATVLAILLAAAGLLTPASPGRLGLWFGALGCALAPLAPWALAHLGQAPWPRLAAGIRPATAVDAGAIWPALGQASAGLALGLGFAIWGLFGLAAVCVAGAVTTSVPAAAAMLGAAAGNLAFALPVNGLAGLGPAQAAWVLATTWAGVPHQDAVVSALALHAVVLSNALLLGGLAIAGGFGRSGALSDPRPLVPRPADGQARKAH